MRADGSEKRQIALGHSARWSPRGDWIAFARGRIEESGYPSYRYPAYYSLFLVRGTGGRIRRLLRADLTSPGFAWAPDGRRLAVSRRHRCLTAGVYIVGPNGRSRSITNDCRIRGTRRNDVLVGTEEPDLVSGFAGADRIDTNPGDKWTYGWGGDADIVWAGPGNDFVRTGTSQDVAYGGPGADRIEGGNEKDTLFGGAGDDVLYGGRNNDRLHGGNGRDRLFGGQLADVLLARDAEPDELVCGPGQDQARVDRSDRVAADCETVFRG
jgi:RTX calcium-binding nonapeptide repeat (4 copies)/WD40-like Beta Propeller Repeat